MVFAWLLEDVTSSSDGHLERTRESMFFIVSCKALWGWALCHDFLAYFLFQFLLCACCVCSNSSPTNALLPLAGINEVAVIFVSGNRVIHMHQVGYSSPSEGCWPCSPGSLSVQVPDSGIPSCGAATHCPALPVALDIRLLRSRFVSTESWS